MPIDTTLSPREAEILSEIARGLTIRQIALKQRTTVPTIGGMVNRMYAKKLRIRDMGTQSRAFALAKAFTRHNFTLPDELNGAKEAFESGRVAFEDELDPIILAMILEGHSIPDLADILRLPQDLVRDRVDTLRLRLELATYPVFSVAVSALCAGLLPQLQLDQPFTPTEADVMTLAEIVLDISADQGAEWRKVPVYSIQAEREILRFRLAARTPAEAVEMAITGGWLTLDSLNRQRSDLVNRFKEGVGLVQVEGLKPVELRIIDLLGLGLSRSEIKQRLPPETFTHRKLDSVLTWLLRHIGINSSAALVAVARFAGNPVSAEPEPEPDGPLFSLHELDLIAVAASGQSQDEMTSHFGLAKGAIPRELGLIYRKLSAINLEHAVALAARDGLLDEYLATLEPELVPDGLFSEYYIRYLEQVACGKRLFDILDTLHTPSSKEHLKKIEEDEAKTDLPMVTRIVILAQRGAIEVIGPQVVPFPDDAPETPEPSPNELLAAQSDNGIQAPESGRTESSSVETGLADAQQQSPDTRPAPARPTSHREELVLSGARRLITANASDSEVKRNRAALSRKLRELIGANFTIMIRAIRDGQLERPEWDPRFTDRQLSSSVSTFLVQTAREKTLEAIRQDFEDYRDNPQAFRQWYMKYVCTPLGAHAPRDAAAIALWAKLITIS